MGISIFELRFEIEIERNGDCLVRFVQIKPLLMFRPQKILLLAHENSSTIYPDVIKSYSKDPPF